MIKATWSLPLGGMLAAAGGYVLESWRMVAAIDSKVSDYPPP